MPQLDTLTYFSQFTWFIIIFLSFYVLLSNNVIPSIGTILKIRNKITKNTISHTNITKEKSNLDILITNTLSKK
jgi:F0F1-type ATP synthase membrane subunit b/b'